MREPQLNLPRPAVVMQYWNDPEIQELDGKVWGMQEAHKKDLLRWYGARYGLDTFVETGTYTGEAILALCNDFDELYSVEVNPDYFYAASNRLAHIQNKHLYLGNSGALLKQVLDNLMPRPTLFWLDAHANNIAPMQDEFDTVFAWIQTGAILVDDVQGFWHNDWPRICKENAEKHPDWQYEVIAGVARFVKE